MEEICQPCGRWNLVLAFLLIVHVAPESSGGRYLIRQGDINVGSHVNIMFRLRCNSSAPLGSPHEMQVLMQDRRHTTYFGRLYCTLTALGNSRMAAAAQVHNMDHKMGND